MPTVRAIVAAELRAVAKSARFTHQDEGWCVPTYALNDRADEIEARS